MQHLDVGVTVGREVTKHLGSLSLVIYIIGSGQASDMPGGNKTLPPSSVSQPIGQKIRDRANISIGTWKARPLRPLRSLKS